MTSFVPLSPCSVNVVGGAWGQLTDLQASIPRQSQKPTFHQLRCLEDLEPGMFVSEKEPFV